MRLSTAADMVVVEDLLAMLPPNVRLALLSIDQSASFVVEGPNGIKTVVCTKTDPDSWTTEAKKFDSGVFERSRNDPVFRADGRLVWVSIPRYMDMRHVNSVLRQYGINEPDDHDGRGISRLLRHIRRAAAVPPEAPAADPVAQLTAQHD